MQDPTTSEGKTPVSTKGLWLHLRCEWLCEFPGDLGVQPWEQLQRAQQRIHRCIVCCWQQLPRHTQQAQSSALHQWTFGRKQAA